MKAKFLLADIILKRDAYVRSSAMSSNLELHTVSSKK
jgi:hypothetical protein